MNYRSGGAASIARTRPIVSGMALLAGLGFAAAPGHAAGTIAGTTIDNVATATYDLPTGGNTSVTSNTVTLTVDEVLDVTVAWADPGDVTTAPSATNQVLRFTLTNAGNGSEAFRLTPVDTSGGDDFNPSVTSVVLDTNSNGAYDAGLDTVYVAGANDPVLAPDASTTIFILSTIPGTATDGQRGRADLQAAAVTGSGAPGTTFAGAGQGGGAAVVGATGADAEDDGYYVVSAATLAFVKSATVTDPFGGTNEIPGSIITYTLIATVSGSGSLANVRVNDPIPAGTTYRPGTITLDAGALTDANDADAGRFTGTDVSVGLGNVAAGSTRTITFQVDID
jgi:uncharacterized repeat protein (TIGR01451 family)